MHEGRPKVWYLIPPEDGKKFELLIQRIFKNKFGKCQNVFRHKYLVIDPQLFVDNNIRVNKVRKFLFE